MKRGVSVLLSQEIAIEGVVEVDPLRILRE
jgi:hypothetical protein